MGMLSLGGLLARLPSAAVVLLPLPGDAEAAASSWGELLGQVSPAAALCTAGLLAVGCRLWWQSAKASRLRYAGSLLFRKRYQKSEVCIGAIFGMDVGGTLSKVCYFEALPDKKGGKKKGRRRRSRRGRSFSSRPSSAGREERKSLDGEGGGGGDGSGRKSRSSYAALRLDGPEEVERARSDMSRLGADDVLSPRTPGSDAPTPLLRLRKIRSFDNLERPDHMSVLREFYRIMEETRKLGQTGVREEELQFYSEELGGTLHFIRFETRRMEGAMDFVAANSLHMNITHIPCTGGGAYKYANIVKDRLGIDLDKHDEMECLVRGMQFVLDNVKDEVYTYKPSPKEAEEAEVETMRRKDKEFTLKTQLSSRTVKRSFPYMVVSIGTGVSMIKVDGPGKFERVSGSSIGGGTYWGLCRLFTSCRTFKEVLDLAEGGDTSRIDMLVGDIYGGDYASLGLPSNAVASSFGKLVMKPRAKDGVRESDFARALLMMITNNIGQVAYLNAIQHNVKHIYFIGSFMRHNDISATRLAYAIDFWSKGTMEALFLEHEGFFGALGAFLGSSYSITKRGGGGSPSPAHRNRKRAMSYEPETKSKGSHPPPRRTTSEVYSGGRNPRKVVENGDGGGGGEGSDDDGSGDDIPKTPRRTKSAQNIL